MRKNVFTILLFSLYALAATPGKTGFLFLNDDCNPQGFGVARSQSAFFSRINPASPAFAGGPYTSVIFGESQDLRKGAISIVGKTPTAFFGGSFSTITIPGIQNTSEQGIAPYSFLSSTGSTVSLCGGLNNQRLAAAIAISGTEERIATFTHYAIFLSGGALYRIIPDKLTAGFAAFNQGYATSMLSNGNDWHNDRLPRHAGAGLEWHDTLYSIEYRLTTDVFYYDLTQRIVSPFAAEVWLVPSFCIRAGHRINHETEFATAGFGLRLQPLQIDMTITLNRTQGVFETPSWLLGLTYVLPGQPQQK